MSTTKVGENITNILKLLFFTINLHFVVSKQISGYRKLNLLRTSSVYLVFLPLEVQRRLQQTKVYHEFSHFVWKETTHKPLKATSAKTLFSNVFVIYTTSLMNNFYSVWKLEDITFLEKLRLHWDFLKRHGATFFEASVLKEVRISYVICRITIWC